MAQVLRLSDDVHKEVSHYAAKREKKMSEVSDEIVRAGLAALARDGVSAVAVSDDKPEAPDEDRASLLSQALRGLRVEGPNGETGVLALVDAEVSRWNTSKRGASAQRGRVETVLAAISTAARRWAAVNRYVAERA